MICSACEKDKSPEEFHLDNRNPRGRQYECKYCRSTNKEYAQAAVRRVRTWREDNPVADMLRRARARARKERVPFDITKEDILVPEICPVLGMKTIRSKGRMARNSPSLDKIVPSLGYIKGNVMVISMRANSMKSDAAPAELLAFARWIRRSYGA